MSDASSDRTPLLSAADSGVGNRSTMLPAVRAIKSPTHPEFAVTIDEDAPALLQCTSISAAIRQPWEVRFEGLRCTIPIGGGWRRCCRKGDSRTILDG